MEKILLETQRRKEKDRIISSYPHDLFDRNSSYEAFTAMSILATLASQAKDLLNFEEDARDGSLNFSAELNCTEPMVSFAIEAKFS